MHFEVAHEFDIPLDALELAVLSPDLAPRYSARALAMKIGIERVVERHRSFHSGIYERTWHYQANVTIPKFARGYVTREMCAWDEQTTYDMSKHRGTWSVLPNVKPEWRRYFESKGTYTLEPLGGGRSRRRVQGEVALRVRVVRQVAERLIVNEVRKAYEAEAATLHDLATLA